MTENIRGIFKHNIDLLREIYKAVYYFRKQQYDRALGLMANSIDQIKFVIEGIVSDREYFQKVETESMLEMLSGILEAKRNMDFILLADLLELQLIGFLTGVQELIMSKEEIVFDEDNYNENIKLLLERGVGFTKQFTKPIDTDGLLESGYRVEFTSCGRMTLAAENDGTKFYFHTNNQIQTEAFLLAEEWYEEDIKKYVIYGLGMGYHIEELQDMAPDASFEVYEADPNVIQLACAFANIRKLLMNPRIKIIFDPELSVLKQRVSTLGPEEVYRIHYPSYRNHKNEEGAGILETVIPWSKHLKSVNTLNNLS